MAVEPAERDVKDFSFRHVVKVRVNPSEDGVLNQRTSLLAISNKYGFTFVGVPSGFKVLKTIEIGNRAAELEKTANLIVDDLAVWCQVELGTRPTHLAVSSDDLSLAVTVLRGGALQLLVFDIRAFAIQNVSSNPFGEMHLSAQGDIHIQELQWNPGVDFTSLLAVVLSDGSVSLLEVTDKIKTTASLPNSACATCCCWSPKGKQLVIGRTNGSFAQFDQQLQEKKAIPAPSCFENAVSVVDILWQSTHTFLAAFLPGSSEPGEQPSLVVINTPKGGGISYIAHDDVCFGSGETRQPKYFMTQLVDWDMVILASASALEAAVLGRNPENKQLWEHWNLEDTGRAELPLTEDEQRRETYPTGMAIDLTSQHEMPIGESGVAPPMPMLMLLSDDHVLTPFYMLNTAQGIPTLTHKPHVLTEVGARTSLAGKSGVTSSNSVSVNQTPGSMSAAKSLFPSSISATQSQSAQFGTSSQLSQPAAVKSLSFTGTNSGGFGFPQSAALGPPRGPSPVYPSSTAPGVAQPTAGFVRFTQPTVTANTAATLVAPQPQAASVSLQPGGPQAVRPPAASLSGTLPAWPSKMAVSAGTEPKLQTGQAAPQEDVRVGSLATGGPSAGMQANRIMVPTPQSYTPNKPSITKPVPESGAGEGRPRKRSASSADNTFTRTILEEMEHFQREVNELRQRASKLEVKVGSQEELRALHTNTNDMYSFCADIKDTTQSLHTDIHHLKTDILEDFSLAEEARLRCERDEEPTYQQMLRRRPLDPASAKLMKEINTQTQYLDNCLKEVDFCLDLDWERFQQRCKNRARIMETPAVDAIYRTVANNRNILGSQTLSLEHLSTQLQQLKVHNTGDNWQHHRLAPIQPNKNSNMSSSEQTGLSPHPVPSSPASPDKQARLRELLAKRRTTPIRCSAPANLSMSKIVSASGLASLLSDSEECEEEEEEEEEEENEEVVPYAPIQYLPGSMHQPPIYRPPAGSRQPACQQLPVSMGQATSQQQPPSMSRPGNQLLPASKSQPVSQWQPVSQDKLAPLAGFSNSSPVPPRSSFAQSTVDSQSKLQLSKPIPTSSGKPTFSVPQSLQPNQSASLVPVKPLVHEAKTRPVNLVGSMSTSPSISTPSSGPSITAGQSQVVLNASTKTRSPVSTTVKEKEGGLKLTTSGFSIATVSQTISTPTLTQNVASIPRVENPVPSKAKTQNIGSERPNPNQSGKIAVEQPTSIQPVVGKPQIEDVTPPDSPKPRMPAGGASVTSSPAKESFSDSALNTGKKPAIFGTSSLSSFSFTSTPASKGFSFGENIGLVSSSTTHGATSMFGGANQASRTPVSTENMGSVTALKGEKNVGNNAKTEPTATPLGQFSVGKGSISSGLPITTGGTSGAGRSAVVGAQINSEGNKELQEKASAEQTLPDSDSTVSSSHELNTATTVISATTASTIEASEQKPSTGFSFSTASTTEASEQKPSTGFSFSTASTTEASEQKPSTGFSFSTPSTSGFSFSSSSSNFVFTTKSNSLTAPSSGQTSVSGSGTSATSSLSSFTFGGKQPNVTADIPSSAPKNSSPADSNQVATTSTATTTTQVETSTTPSAFGNGLFGSTQSTTAPAITTTTSIPVTSSSNGNGLFGSTKTSESSFSFGSGQSSDGPSFSKLASSASKTSENTGPGLFAAPTTTTSTAASGFSFVQTDATNNSNLFGQNRFGSETSKPTTFGQAGGQISVFGNQSTPTSSSGSVFGQPASSSGGETGSVFGGGSGGAGIFSGLGGKPSAENANKNVFGSTQAFGTGSSQNQGLFGNSGGSSDNVGFTSPTNTTAPNFGGGFSNSGGSVAASGFGSFGASPQTAKSSQPVAAGFGAAPVFGSPTSFGSQTQFGGSFGSGATFSNPLGSMGASSSPNASHIFGSQPSSEVSNQGFAGFASSNSPSFGALAQAGTSPVFAQTGSGFGQGASPGQACGGFGQGASTGTFEQAGFGQPSSPGGFGGSPAFGGGFNSPASQGNSFMSYRG